MHLVTSVESQSEIYLGTAGVLLKIGAIKKWPTPLLIKLHGRWNIINGSYEYVRFSTTGKMTSNQHT